MITDLPKTIDKVSCLSMRKGSLVSFGHYWQPESKIKFAYDVEWIALKEKSNAMLLLSREGIYCKPFDTNGKSIWRDSSLRTWLNEDWIQNCFGNGDESLIVPAPADDPLRVKDLVPYSMPNEGFRTKSEDEDYVFLLNEDELDELLTDRDFFLSPHWMAVRTAEERPETVKWWIRNDDDINCFCIDENGNYTECNPDSDMVFVRPAIWIDNFYIERLHRETVTEWKTNLRNVRKNQFDYEEFCGAASKAFSILYLYSNWIDTVISCPKIVIELMMLIAKYSETHLDDECDEHLLAMNAAASLCSQSLDWKTIYKNNPKPGQPGALKNGFIMKNLNGEVIVVDGRTFDMKNPLDKRHLAEEGYYTM